MCQAIHTISLSKETTSISWLNTKNTVSILPGGIKLNKTMQSGTSEPDVIRVKEFARRMQISVWTARQWAYRGKVTSVKAGKLLLIPTSEVARLIAEHTRPYQETAR
jgi:excisionase family DNA binding protein